jgi:hypothetical protein
LNVDECKDAAHAALSVFVHSVEDPDADVVARIVERYLFVSITALSPISVSAFLLLTCVRTIKILTKFVNMHKLGGMQKFCVSTGMCVLWSGGVPPLRLLVV